MTPDDVEPAGIELFGESWRVSMPLALGVDPSTVRRWHGWETKRNGNGTEMVRRAALPGIVAAALHAWLELRRRHGTVPPPEPRLPFGGGGAPDDGWDGTPASVDRAGETLFGRKWKSPLTKALGINPATLWRQLEDGGPGPGEARTVPGPLTAALRAWLAVHALDGRLPPTEPGMDFQPRVDRADGRSPPRRKRKSGYGDLLSGN